MRFKVMSGNMRIGKAQPSTVTRLESLRVPST
jgi:hypothetical protein